MATAIEFNNISKLYRLGMVSTGTLAHDLKRWWTVNVCRQEDPYLKLGEENNRSAKGESDYVWALRDISFKVEQGDVLGIIGKNGAGKSTLLKILSRVTAPTTGTIRARGRIGSLLEVGTGFHPEMTGRENIYLNGAILGMTKAEITRKLDEIVDFSGCERYIDTPIKRYSSGMMVRLGFAVAAHLDPEILVVDEVLAVGDAEFQKKAIGKMQNISRSEGRTVLFVSHNMGAIQKLCTRSILLERGKIAASGDTASVVHKYLGEDIHSTTFVTQPKESPIYVQSICLQNGNGDETNNFLLSENIYVKTELHISGHFPETYLLLTVLDNMKRKVFSAEKAVEKTSTLCIEPHFLTRGTYFIQAIIYRPAICQYDFIETACQFDITDDGSPFSHLETFDYGCVFGSSHWQE